MPELPEVEYFRKYSTKVLGKKITRVEVKEPAVLTVKPSKLKKLTGKAFKETHRHGKYLFLKQSDKTLVAHFGMTGSVSYYKERLPDYPAVIFSLANEHHYSINSTRKLGEVGLINSIKSFIKEKELGPDAIRVSKKEFKKLFSERRGMVKTALMDQSLIAGIGNIYSDEILFQLGWHPCTKLKDRDLGQLYKTMNKVLSKLSGSLINNRSPGKRCPKCGGRIKRIKVSSRSSYYCNKHQEKQ